uniref:Pancreatic triacylglycerol lipase n=1 Tax=Daphnia magna TaxID=35525 RepID=A0A0P6G748_9CRUS
MKFFAVLLLAVSAVSAKSLSERNLGESRDFISDNTHFNLWTRNNQLVFQELINGNGLNLATSNFDQNKPTKIFAHGWLMDGHSNPTVIDMKNAFLQHEDCNFIAVDWETMANNANYYASAADTLPVGILTGQFIDFLVSQGVTYSSIHVIGFSLGAHVAGNAGATVAGTLPRITGLDPAYPGFSVENPGERLDTTDARFVDVMHTNSAKIVGGGLSFPVPIGHVDFWPNGGVSQPGCFATGTDILDLATGCSHGRAPLYFTESINSRTPFTSTECFDYDTWKAGRCSGNAQTAMGLSVSTSANGEYFLDTNAEAPFALG